MTSITTKPDSLQREAETAPQLFENWFDPIETEVRGRARQFIDELIRGELDAVLARPRYGRGKTASGEKGTDVTGHRHGSRTRSLTGAFGPIEIEVPRARLNTAEGKTTEWRSRALRAYQRRTLAADALIAGVAFAQQALKERVVGMWRLLSWESVRSNGEAVNVWMGAHPTGTIMYLPNGYMAVQVLADPRPTFADNPATTSSASDEFRGAYWGYYAYWGTYTVNDAGDGVVHNVLASERPNEVGMKYPRSVSINGAKLVITTASYKAGALLPHDVLDRAHVRDDEELFNRLTFDRVE
jgi:hypothetical protein